MRLRLLAAFLVGAWLAGSLFMDLVATGNFRSVDRLLSAPSPQMAERVQAMGGRDSARMLLRHLVGEQNRWYFTSWEQAQIWLGMALLLMFLFPGRRALLIPLLMMLGIVLAMHFFLTPEITRLGRAIDFLPPPASSEDRTRFWRLHGIYSASELIKLGVGIVLAAVLVRKT